MDSLANFQLSLLFQLYFKNLEDERQNIYIVKQFRTKKLVLRKKNLPEKMEIMFTTRSHEERPRACRKKDDRNGVTGKEEKRGTKEKIFRCCEKRYGGSCCKGDGC